ncbi:MAG: S-layer homology domain-containing protein [Oscillospiraceae bacterium]|nr:S-layer homology domain-containing protein [Oscillospiraceae bacterium]
MKTARKVLSLLLSLALVLSLLPGLSVTARAAGSSTSTLNFTSKCNGSGTADDGVAWTVTSDAAETTFDGERGIHYGSNNKEVQYIRLSTSGITAAITKVVVNATAADGVMASVNVTVGGTAFGGDAKVLGTNPYDYTFEGSGAGEIVVTVSKPSAEKKALYVKSVVVTYSTSSSVAVTGVTLDKTSATLTVDGDAVALTATVAPEDATDKTVVWSDGGTNSGAVKLYTDADCTAEVGAGAVENLTVYAKGISAGSATVTATSSADSTKSATCAVTVNAAQTHTHNEITFSPWTSADSLPTEGGSYYLTQDVTIGSTWDVPTGTVNLSLNGHGISYSEKENNASVITVGNNAILNLYDYNTTTVHKYTVNEDGLAVVDGADSGDTVKSFTGGYITGGTGTKTAVSTNQRYGGGVYVNGGTFNMTGGTIIGNTATYGGGVYVDNGGTFNMNGGTIIGNTANFGGGGGVYVDSGDYDYDNSKEIPGGTFNMNGGTISGNTAEDGGGVYVASGYYDYDNSKEIPGGTFNMNGGTISGNTAEHGGGGGVYVDSGYYDYDNNKEIPGGTFNMNDGTISGNKAYYGGGVYFYEGTFTMNNDAAISGNTAEYGGGVYFYKGTFTMNSDAAISGNTAEHGGGVYFYYESTFTMNNNAAISCNTAGEGGGVYFDDGTFTMNNNAAISGNTSEYKGGGVYIDCEGNETIIVSGTPVVKNNLGGATRNEETGALTGGSASNVYCSAGYPIFAFSGDNELDTGASIGVSMGYLGVFTSGLADGTAQNYLNNKYFFSDNGEVNPIIVTGGQLALAQRHDVSHSVTMTHGTVTADPALPGDSVTLKVQPDSGYQLKEGTLKVVKGVPAIKTGDIVTKDQIDKIQALVESQYVDEGVNVAIFDFDGVDNLTEDTDRVMYKYKGDGNDPWQWLEMGKKYVEADVYSTDWRCIYAFSADILFMPNTYAFSPADIIAEVGIYTFEEIEAWMNKNVKEDAETGNRAIVDLDMDPETDEDQTIFTLNDDGELSCTDEAALNELRGVRWQCLQASPDKNVYYFTPCHLIPGEIVDIGQIESALKAGYISEEYQKENAIFPYNTAAFFDSFDLFDIDTGSVHQAAYYSCTSQEESAYDWLENEDLPEEFPLKSEKTYTADDVKSKEWVLSDLTPILNMALDLNEYNTYIFVDATVALNEYTFIMPDANVMVIAEFEPEPAVTGVTLDKTSATLTVGGDPATFTATVSPENATDKSVKWSVGGTDAGAVKLYSDADCITEVGAAATETLTVYAKGISAGSATVTATSNADSTKTANCEVTVNAAEYSVTITAGSNMTKTTESGAESQTGLSGEMTDVVYTANEGYYFPTDYSVTAVNGISVTRNSYTQITVSGTPTADAAITLTAPTAKKVPATGDFYYSDPGPFVYDGDPKAACVEPNRPSGVEGMGEITVHYYSDSSCNTEVQNPTDAGTYYVGITVAEGDVYKAVSDVLHDASWKFTINRKTPIATDFTYNAPSDLTYDGSAKTVTVEPKEGVNGMGEVTVKYYSDQWRTNEVTPTNVGTYYVGITLSLGNNYHNASSALYDQNWQFTISKQAAPASLNDDQKPTANTGLTYTGNELELVTAPTGNVPAGYTVQYSLDGTKWSADLPKGANAGDYTVKVKYVGDENHEDFNGTDVTVTISKINPTYTIPTGLTATHGQTLADVNLDTGWAWADSTQSVGNVGTNSFSAIFTPTDTTNYNTVTVNASVSVSKAAGSTATAISTENMSWSSDCVNIEGTAGQEYIIVPKGTVITAESWQSSLKPDAERENWVFFTELTPATEYVIYTRTAETDTHNAGEPVNANVHTDLESIGMDFDGDLLGAAFTVKAEPETEGLTYKWYQDTVTDNGEGGENHALTEIADATGSSYTSGDADVGKQIAVKIFRGESEVGETNTDFAIAAAATVTFDSKGGRDVEPQTGLSYNSKVTEPEGITRSGYILAGWYADEKYEIKWDFDADTVKWADTTLYAKWRPIYIAPAATTVTVPVSGDAGEENVSVKISGDKAILDLITDAQIANAIGEDGKRITIDLTGMNGSYEFEISKAAGEKIADAVGEDGKAVIWLKESTGETDAFYGIEAPASFSKGSHFWVRHIEPTDSTLTDAVRDYYFDNSQHEQWIIDAGMTSDGKEVHDLGGDTVNLYIAVGDDWSADDMRAVFISEDGKTENVACGPETVVNQSGEHRFARLKLNHFSTYILRNMGDCPINEFTDADANAWYHDGVHFVLENKLMSGYGNGKFGPADYTSRAMVAQILWNIEGKPASTYEMNYTDVAEDAWYADAIRWATEKGVVTGYGDGKFGPDDNITREQLAAIIYRYAQSKGQGFTGMWMFRLDYEDAASVSDWASEAMHWMVMKGIIKGQTDKTLAPKRFASRAEIATMIMRYAALEK